MKFEDQLKEQFAEATGHKFEEMVELKFEEWKKEFIRLLKEDIDKWAIHGGYAMDYQNVQELKTNIIDKRAGDLK